MRIFCLFWWFVMQGLVKNCKIRLKMLKCCHFVLPYIFSGDKIVQLWRSINLSWGHVSCHKKCGPIGLTFIEYKQTSKVYINRRNIFPFLTCYNLIRKERWEGRRIWCIEVGRCQGCHDWVSFCGKVYIIKHPY